MRICTFLDKIELFLIMELSFDKLLEFDIKRLNRPKFRHELAQFNDPTILSEEQDSVTSSTNTQSTDEKDDVQLWKI
jgi:hypothetical protein